MIKKAIKQLFMLRYLTGFGFDQYELLFIYKSCFRPVVEYADVFARKQSGILNVFRKELAEQS